jgi:hypothetical protein
MALSDFIVRGVGRVRQTLGMSTGWGMERFELDPSAVGEEERNQTDLHKLFYEHHGLIIHKWRHYLSIYDRHLARFRGQPFRLLEIGVSEGGSLQLWRKYFGPEAIVFGVDINPRCQKLNGRDAQVRIGSQTDRAFLEKTVAEMGGVDVVIDDGSHIASHQRKTLKLLWPHLSPNGVYICEDLHTSYWRGAYQGGYRRPSTFLEVAKRAIDDIHGDFHGRGEDTEGASRSIDGIHFYNSMVVIEKRPQPSPTHVKVGSERTL